MAAAQEHPDDILSLYGRRLHRGRYNYTGIGRTTEFQQVDMPVMLYWMPVAAVAEVRAGYAKWIAKGHPPVLLDDDILVAVGHTAEVLRDSQGRGLPASPPTPCLCQADAQPSPAPHEGMAGMPGGCSIKSPPDGVHLTNAGEHGASGGEFVESTQRPGGGFRAAANYNKPIRSNSHLIGADYRGPVPGRVPQMPVPLTNG